MFSHCTKCILVVGLILTLYFHSVAAITLSSSSTCKTSLDCTVREWLSSLQDEAYVLECTAIKLEKTNLLLSKANYSTTSVRGAQLEKVKKALATLIGEIQIINSTCSQYYGPDCNLVCDSKCLNCSSNYQCTQCSGNWDGANCTTCKTGWTGSNCTIPVCDSKCLTCVAPGQCSSCSGNWNGITCSGCKTGWSGSNCTVPVCDYKCTTCIAPGQCSQCSGNWNGTTCSTCKTGWNGTNCNTPICDSKCLTCAAPYQCSQCSGNWNGTTCSNCIRGWTGSDCNTVLQIGDFASTTLLNSTQITKFMNQVMKGVAMNTPKLLYKAVRDGFSASTFHTKCDNLGPTLLVVKSQSGAVFGAYASVSWGIQNDYFTDWPAFLFSVVSASQEERFSKLTQQYATLKNGSNAFSKFHRSYFGPTFGGGHDLYISDLSNTNSNSYANICTSYCDAVMIVNSDTAKNYLAGSYYFQVQDYEVYSW